MRFVMPMMFVVVFGLLAQADDSETIEWFGMPDDKDLPSIFSIEYVRAWKRQPMK